MVKYFDKLFLPDADYKVHDLIMLETQNIKTKQPTRKL